MYVQLLTNPLKNYKNIVVSFGKTIEISRKILHKNAFSVLIYVKTLLFSETNIFSLAQLKLWRHVIPTWESLVRVFSDVLVAFLYFDICHYRQSNLAIENPEFSQPVVAGHFQRKIW